MNSKQEHFLQSGRTIGNYVVTKNLGEGTFGKVKLGIHTHTGQKVAIKILQKNKIVDVADVERVTREIHILKQIRHPNVIQLYEIIETPKQLFLVMEYVSEGELFEHIVKKKRLKEQEACEYFKQLLAGVEYLHELNIVHRDLKPQNLLIDFNHRLKLVDFGLSNTYKSKQLLKTACGSPCYAAPEMIAGKKYNGLNADLWSCGVVLFAMMCGYLPFQDPNTTLLYKKIIAGQFSIPKFVSPGGRELLHGILTTDPDRRFTIRDIKNHAWYRQITETPNLQLNGIKVGLHQIPVDPQLLETMLEYNQNPEEAKKYIQNNRHNHSITVYYLLLKRNLRNGLHSEHDICSPQFDPSKLLKKNQRIQAESQTKPEPEKGEHDLQEINLDRVSTAFNRTNRLISRLSNLRSEKQKDYSIHQKKAESVELKFDTDNLPLVDMSKVNVNYNRRRIHQLIHKDKKDEKEMPEETSDPIEQPIVSKFHQTIATGWRRPVVSFRTSVNRSIKEKPKKQMEFSLESKNDRYTSLEVPALSISTEKQKQVAAMNRTFMGKIPKAYMPRWENQSERIRSILNTTISGHGKRKPKLNIFY